MVTDRKEAVHLEQDLQLQHLKPEYIRTHKYEPRLAELQLHQQRVDVHCQDMLDVLSFCRTELQQLKTSIRDKNQNLFLTLSNMEDEVQKTSSTGRTSSVERLEAVGSALQDCLDQHLKDIQSYRTSFRQMVQSRLEETKRRTAELQSSFRTFKEGGDFSPRELKMFQRRLKKETKRTSETEESLYSELEDFESMTLQQVREASAPLQEKLSVLKSELEFIEEIQRIIGRSQIQIKAESLLSVLQAAISNQQQSVISSRLEDIKRTMENKQVSPDEVCCLLSSTHEDISKRCQYLDYSLNSAVQDSLVLSAHPESRKQVRLSTQSGSLQLSRTGVDFYEDPVVGVVRFSLVQDPGAENTQRRRTPAAGSVSAQSSVQHQQMSISTQRKGSRPARTDIRTEKRFQIFGSKQEAELSPQSFSSTLQSILWTTNDTVLQLSEDFYRSKRLSSFFLLPVSLDQWAESTQQSLLGYQDQARRFLSESKQEVVKQLSVFRELLSLFPAVLISNHEQQQGAWLREEVGGARKKLEELMSASNKEKKLNVHQLRVSLRDQELQILNSTEELRQQQLHSAIIRTHLEQQVCMRVRAEEFVTSLASLSEKLLHQVDELLTPAETDAAVMDHSSVTMETGAETGSDPCRGSRTWSGITFLFPPTKDSADSSSSVTMTTASITTATSSLEHQEVIKYRDAAVERFQQLLQSETSRSDEDKRRHLSEEHSWNSHWRQEIHTLTHIRHTNT
ncbi:coiled-coil domain-containing protein 180 [Austrofundulus limnaeus]|uniref:Coiled-coil domain-containing protein 180 n=1 Tax=Austrofundulus limnaeus TaxID=52670 RepID=A0A2I4D1A2_AUSLI|nr:PREDICTED: coiled-coil domain-containing protein 180 [Austrofundulus limnaeus]